MEAKDVAAVTFPPTRREEIPDADTRDMFSALMREMKRGFGRYQGRGADQGGDRDPGPPRDGGTRGPFQERPRDNTCFRCGQWGHYASLCPNGPNNGPVPAPGGGQWSNRRDPGPSRYSGPPARSGPPAQRGDSQGNSNPVASQDSRNYIGRLQAPPSPVANRRIRIREENAESEIIKDVFVPVRTEIRMYR